MRRNLWSPDSVYRFEMEQAPISHPFRLPRIRFGWIIFLCVVAWTAYCQYWMIRSHLKDHHFISIPGQHWNLYWDLPHNLIFTCLEFILFLAIIRPWSYEILDTASRAGGLALIWSMTALAAFSSRSMLVPSRFFSASYCSWLKV